MSNLQRESLDHFDAAAVEWDEKPSRRERAQKAAACIRRHVPLSSDMHVMDYGGATGTLGLLLAPDVAHVTVADASEGMIGVLTDKLAASPVTNISALHCPPGTETERFPSVDLVVSSMTLHHIKNLDALLAAFRKCLRSGGRVCIIDLLKEDGSFHGDRVVPHNGFDPDALTLCLESAGFCEIEWEPFDTYERDTDNGPRAFPLFAMTGRRND